MLTIDAQVHAYERNHPGRPWAGVLQGPPEVTGDQMVAAMDAVGVDGAILVSPFSLYRYDASYALVDVHERLVDRLGRFGAQIKSYWLPGQWVPHCTLAAGGYAAATRQSRQRDEHRAEGSEHQTDRPTVSEMTARVAPTARSMR
jgi:hypothetical protein